MFCATFQRTSDAEESVLQDDAAELELAETQSQETDDSAPVEAEVECVEGKEAVKSQKLGKKRRQSSPTGHSQMQNIGAMASAATAVLTQIVQKKDKEDTGKSIKTTSNDKDWDFCRYIYHKIKAIPDGDEKEDMQLEIQKLIADTRRRCQLTAVGQLHNPAMMQPFMSYEGCDPTQMQSTTEVIHHAFADLQGNY